MAQNLQIGFSSTLFWDPGKVRGLGSLVCGVGLRGFRAEFRA